MASQRGTHRGRVVILVLGVAAFAVSVLAIVVPFVASWNERGSDPDSLVVSSGSPAAASRVPGVSTGAEPSTSDQSVEGEGQASSSLRAASPVTGRINYDDLVGAPEDVVLWNVPVTAPFADFPPSDDGACGPAQLAWLERHAAPHDADQSWVHVELSSASTYGSAVSLTDVRAVGKLTETPSFFSLSCTSIGGDASQLAVLDLYGGGVAVYSDRRDSGDQIPGSIVTVNISPGELVELYLEIAPHEHGFSGAIEATMISPVKKTITLVESVELPAAPRNDFSVSMSYGTLNCQNHGFTSAEFFPADSVYWDCMPAEVVAHVNALDAD